MHLFKSSQLAAWLSPLHSQSFTRATCRLFIWVPLSKNTSTSPLLMPEKLLVQKNLLTPQLEAAGVFFFVFFYEPKTSSISCGTFWCNSQYTFGSQRLL